MKKIDKLIIKSFIGPAVLSYFIATFVLVMQFLWKYIDDILGKGVTIFELMELITYYAITLIPMAVPITILISSVMVYGDMAEKYELSSMKSAGISLLRILLPGLSVAIIIGCFSVFASNYLKPASLLQFNKRFITIRKQKTALAIEQGIFNDAFNETIIRVNKIEKNKKDINDVLIYDHTANDKSLIGIMSSKGGQMYTTPDGRYFVMQLDTGIHYKESEKKVKIGTSQTEIPFMRTYFDQWVKTFDMNQFDGDDGLLNFNQKREDMMNSIQLFKSLDSFRMDVRNNNEKINTRNDKLFSHSLSAINTDTSSTLSNSNMVEQLKEQSPHDTVSQDPSTRQQKVVKRYNIDSLRNEKDKLVQSYKNNINDQEAVAIQEVTPIQEASQAYPIPSYVSVQNKRLIKVQQNSDPLTSNYLAILIDSIDYRDVIIGAQTELSRDRDEVLTLNNYNVENRRSFEKYMLRLNQQYSWAMICIVFLFIGAPLGSIIKKGGYGYPLLVAILFYMIFIISTIYGEKLIRNDLITGIYAAWLPCLILTPFAILLTYMALKDKRFNIDSIKILVLKLIPSKTKDFAK